ncbi:MAG TPA: nuclear transport factor 2 family protein [Nocardioides sp.]|nr:nuclear transport factor 2 family protein [Nocardioides sp.]
MEPSRPGRRSALAAALERRDATAAGAYYACDAQLLVPASGLIQGRRAIEEYWATGIALGLSSVRFEAQRIEMLGARRVEVGRYRVAVAPPRTPATVEHGLYVAFERRAADGTWQCVVGVLSPDGPAGPSHTQKETRR